MPKSKTRKKSSPRPAPHAAAAEATNGTLGFNFRGHWFVVDYATADFGRAMFATKLAGRPGTDLAAQFEKLLDCLEAVLGQEQVATLYDVAPDLFSSESAQREFWDGFAHLTVGANLGEPSAS